MRSVESTGPLRQALRTVAVQVHQAGGHAASEPQQSRIAVDPDGDVAVRLDSVLELLMDGDEGAAAALAAMALGDPSSSVREEAVSALGDIGGAIGIQALTQALSDPDAGVQQGAIRALVDIGGDDAVRALVFALSDPDPSLRGAAVDALADVGSAAAVGALRQATTDESDAVREAAGNYLAEL